MKERFVLTQDHLTLLRHAYVSWCAEETGSPQIDPKRPYGNSDVPMDVAEILGWDVGEELTGEQEEEAMILHGETSTALQIALVNLPNLKGIWEKDDSYCDRSWGKIK